jgi:DNA repair protein RecN (Recombination protein N)
MLLELTVENLAIIDRAQVPLGRGLTVLTGETGAGKSLLVDALELVLGGRSEADQVRTGCASGRASLVVEVGEDPDVAELMADLGIAAEEGKMFLSREVSAAGGSTSRINAKQTPVGVLRQLGALLVDLHGQHDHQRLLDESTHLGFLDAWIGEEAERRKVHLADVWRRVQEIERRLEHVRSGKDHVQRTMDLLRHQIAEIRGVAPEPGEWEELEARLSRLQHLERLRSDLDLILELLVRADGAVLERLGAAAKMLDSLRRLDATLDPVQSALESGRYGLEDVCRSLSSYADRLDADPGLLEATAERLDQLRALRRKYGADETEVLRFLAEAEAQLAELDVDVESEALLATDLESAWTEYRTLSNQLSLLRRECSQEFCAAVTQELHDLGMSRASLVSLFESGEPGAGGTDVMRFLFTANLGEPARSLRKVISGGELSRVMLALKAVLAGKGGVRTLVFDEIDSGLGGKDAARVGRKLRKLAEHYQVVVISHLPQIAAQADTHYVISKSERDGRAGTSVELVGGESRVREIARMLAGEQVTDEALAHARALLAGEARAVKS